MIIPIFGFVAIGVGIVGSIYFFIKNGREIKENIAREIEKDRKRLS